jgi:hypothetical protein
MAMRKLQRNSGEVRTGEADKIKPTFTSFLNSFGNLPQAIPPETAMNGENETE